MTYASDMTIRVPAPISIDYSDILPIQDQLSNLNGIAIDIILETPGGIAEVVEDIVDMVRAKYEHVGIIVPGTAKSAGTIFAMAGDEILMGLSSSLGPIDAQIIQANNKRFSAGAFLDGLEKIKKEVSDTKKLNAAYIPILQNISPGEIQHCENAQNFSRTLVTEWLSKYKFKYWDTHSSTGLPVTEPEKKQRANEIAKQLCEHSDWLTHGRSIKIPQLKAMKLEIIDYSKMTELNEAISRYYTLLRMTLESTNMYKLFETKSSQIFRFIAENIPPPATNNPKSALFKMKCKNCHQEYTIQVNLEKNVALEPGRFAYPPNDVFTCPKCNADNNISQARLQIEAQSGKKVVL